MKDSSLLDNYNTAKRALLDHIHFNFTSANEYPVIDCTMFFWSFDKGRRGIWYDYKIEEAKNECSDSRFFNSIVKDIPLKKAVFEGKLFSGVLVGTILDNRALLIFDNSKNFKYEHKTADTGVPT